MTTVTANSSVQHDASVSKRNHAPAPADVHSIQDGAHQSLSDLTAAGFGAVPEAAPYPNQEACLSLSDKIGALAKSVFSKIKSVADYEPSLTVGRSQREAEKSMWSLIDKISNKIAVAQDLIGAAKDKYGELQIANSDDKAQIIKNEKTIQEAKEYSASLKDISADIIDERIKILEIGKTSGLREPNFLRKVASFNRELKGFVQELESDVGSQDGSLKGRAEQYLENVKKHLESQEDAQNSIQSVGADTASGRARRDLALGFTDMFAQRSADYSVTTEIVGAGFSDDALLALLDERQSVNKSLRADNTTDLSVKFDGLGELHKEGSSPSSADLDSRLWGSETKEATNAEKSVSVDLDLELISDEETEVAAANSTIISNERDGDSRPIPFPSTYQSIDRLDSTEKEAEVASDSTLDVGEVESFISKSGMDTVVAEIDGIKQELKKEAKSLSEQQAELTEVSEKTPRRLLGMFFERFSSAVMVETTLRLQSAIEELRDKVRSLTCKLEQKFEDLVSPIQESFGGRSVEISEDKNDPISEALRYIAIPENYRKRLIDFDIVVDNVEKLALQHEQTFRKSKSKELASIGPREDGKMLILKAAQPDGKIRLYVSDPAGGHATVKPFGSIWSNHAGKVVNHFISGADLNELAITEPKKNNLYYIPQKSENVFVKP